MGSFPWVMDVNLTYRGQKLASWRSSPMESFRGYGRKLNLSATEISILEFLSYGVFPWVIAVNLTYRRQKLASWSSSPMEFFRGLWTLT